MHMRHKISGDIEELGKKGLIVCIEPVKKILE